MLLIGMVGAFWGLLRALDGRLTGVPAVLGLMALAAALVWAGLRIQSARWFLFFLTTCWLVTRGAIIVLFPAYVLPGDERYFHDFISRLVPAMAQGSISSLSNIYDFPVWLARSFPFYLPLAAIFGAHDAEAARWLNVFLGAGQSLFLFFIARRLIGGRAARLVCLLLLIFPYHCINVLSYDPQIAGTFFLLLAVWMGVCLSRRTPHSIPLLIGLGICLALALLLAGIQRGGIDLALAAALLITLKGRDESAGFREVPDSFGGTACALWVLKEHAQDGHAEAAGFREVADWFGGTACALCALLKRFRSRNTVAAVLAICLVWLPLRFMFDRWISSQDSNALRTHTLGFMTRGWNLDTAGEYLPLYEQLDVSAARQEKQRTLEAVLVTEFARQPVRSLLVLVPVKIAKFFAIGYASTAEQGLTAAGYTTAAALYGVLRSFYAPLLLGMCLLGLMRCWPSPLWQRPSAAAGCADGVELCRYCADLGDLPALFASHSLCAAHFGQHGNGQIFAHFGGDSISAPAGSGFCRHRHGTDWLLAGFKYLYSGCGPVPPPTINSWTRAVSTHIWAISR